MERQYYYRPLKWFGGKVLKCAGFGAEQPEHRAFYEPYFASNQEKNSIYLDGVMILTGYRGDRIMADTHEEYSPSRNQAIITMYGLESVLEAK